MANQELINYIKDNLAAGFAESQIEAALLAAGWSEVDVREAFLAIPAAPPDVVTDDLLPVEQSWIAKYSKPLIVGLVILVALPALSYGGYLLYQKTQTGTKNVARVPSRQETVQGQTTANNTTDLTITNLSKLPFSPREEVIVAVRTAKPIDFNWVRLQMPGLDLTDVTTPFEFRFSAPGAPGTYVVRVFGPDKAGTAYQTTTTLTVKP